MNWDGFQTSAIQCADWENDFDHYCFGAAGLIIFLLKLHFTLLRGSIKKVFFLPFLCLKIFKIDRFRTVTMMNISVWFKICLTFFFLSVFHGSQTVMQYSMVLRLSCILNVLSESPEQVGFVND